MELYKDGLLKEDFVVYITNSFVEDNPENTRPSRIDLDGKGH